MDAVHLYQIFFAKSLAALVYSQVARTKNAKSIPMQLQSNRPEQNIPQEKQDISQVCPQQPESLPKTRLQLKTIVSACHSLTPNWSPTESHSVT